MRWLGRKPLLICGALFSCPEDNTLFSSGTQCRAVYSLTHNLASNLLLKMWRIVLIYVALLSKAFSYGYGINRRNMFVLYQADGIYFRSLHCKKTWYCCGLTDLFR